MRHTLDYNCAFQPNRSPSEDRLRVQRSCDSGNLALAKWLYQNYSIDIHAYDDAVFSYACLYGNLDIAQWLWSLGSIDIHTEDGAPMRWAIEYGHTDVVKWLQSIIDV